MEEKKTSKLSKSIIVLICLGVIVLTYIFNWICFDGAVTVTRYNNAHSKETIEAVVTRVAKGEDDNGYYWERYISYTFEGVEYNDVYYDTHSREQNTGETVWVEINPELPGELVPDDGDYYISLIISPIFLAVIMLVLYYLISSFIPEMFKYTDGAKNNKFSGVAIGIIAVKQIVESIVFYNRNNSFIYAIFSGIAGVAFVVTLTLVSKKRTNPENEVASK